MTNPSEDHHPSGLARRRAHIRRLQKYVLNPPSKLAAFFGLLPDHILVETVGRVTGKPRRTVVGAHRDRRTVWLVAEQGRHAGYVRNLLAQPRVRVRMDREWMSGTATVMAEDDPHARLASFGNESHAKLVRRFGTAGCRSHPAVCATGAACGRGW